MTEQVGQSPYIKPTFLNTAKRIRIILKYSNENNPTSISTPKRPFLYKNRILFTI